MENNIVMNSKQNTKLYEVYLTPTFEVMIGELDTSNEIIRKYIPILTYGVFGNDMVQNSETEELFDHPCIGTWVYGENEKEAIEKARVRILFHIHDSYATHELSRAKRRNDNVTARYKDLLDELNTNV